MRLAEALTSDHRTRYVILDDHGCLVIPLVRYLKHLDQRGYAPNTLRSYGTSLVLFFEYLNQRDADFRQVTLDTLAGFVSWLKWPYASPKVIPSYPVVPTRCARTINHILTAVASFYDYLWRIDEISVDLNTKTRAYLSPRARTYKGFLYHIAKDQPVEKHLLKQREPKKRPKTLTKAQIEQLLAACRNQRDRLLLRLLYESGLRIGEVLNLWLQDIDIARRTIKVCDHGEGANGVSLKTPSASRSVSVSDELTNRILDYVADAHDETITTNHIFLKLRGPHAGQPLTYVDVNDLFVRLRQQTGIDASAHLFRHTSFTHLAKAGWAPEYLRERAGHAQFQTTYQLYVHPSDEDLQEAWQQTEAQMCLSGEKDEHEECDADHRGSSRDFSTTSD